MNTDLKPCPFCGEKVGIGVAPYSAQYFDGSRVYCTDCRAAGPIKGRAEEACNAWNQRAEIPG